MEILSSILTCLLTGLVGYIVWLGKKLTVDKSTQSKALKILLREELRQLHDKYMKDKYITADDLAEYMEIYETYHALHGNGRGTLWMEDIEKLERR